jgi:hypothetical protein
MRAVPGVGIVIGVFGLFGVVGMGGVTGLMDRPAFPANKSTLFYRLNNGLRGGLLRIVAHLDDAGGAVKANVMHARRLAHVVFHVGASRSHKIGGDFQFQAGMAAALVVFSRFSRWAVMVFMLRHFLLLLLYK